MRIIILTIFILPIFAIHYDFSKEPIDVVIPCHEKDLSTLELCIEGIRKNGNHIRRIIVVSSKRLTDKAEWFDEKKYPFSKSAIPSKKRAGWIFQQLLKLYAFQVIPNISPNILVLDADTIFLHPVSFMNERGEPFFNVGKENHQPYFEEAKRLLPHFEKTAYSGICHHMLLQKPVLEDLFAAIQGEPWEAILETIEDWEGSGFSEYELYFHFIFSRTDQAHIRKLKWKNTKYLKKIKKYRKKNFSYISCHKY